MFLNWEELSQNILDPNEGISAADMMTDITHQDETTIMTSENQVFLACTYLTILSSYAAMNILMNLLLVSCGCIKNTHGKENKS